MLKKDTDYSKIKVLYEFHIEHQTTYVPVLTVVCSTKFKGNMRSFSQVLKYYLDTAERILRNNAAICEIRLVQPFDKVIPSSGYQESCCWKLRKSFLNAFKWEFLLQYFHGWLNIKSTWTGRGWIQNQQWHVFWGPGWCWPPLRVIKRSFFVPCFRGLLLTKAVSKSKQSENMEADWSQNLQQEIQIGRSGWSGKSVWYEKLSSFRKQGSNYNPFELQN